MFPIRLSPLRLRDVNPFASLLRLTLCSDFSFKLICAEPNLDRDFCERDPDSLKRLRTGFVMMEKFTANNNSVFNASHGFN